MTRFHFTRLAAVLALVLGSAAPAAAQLPSYLGGSGGVAPPAEQAAGSNSDREALLAADVRESLPRLGEEFEVIGPATQDYNAFTYVLGVTDRWDAPTTGTADNPFQSVDEFLGQAGFRRLPTFDVSVRPNREKVVVFAKLGPDGDITEVASAARLETDGSWTAKIGGMALIRFPRLEQLRGPIYGLGVAVYERSAPAAGPYARR